MMRRSSHNRRRLEYILGSNHLTPLTTGAVLEPRAIPTLAHT